MPLWNGEDSAPGGDGRVGELGGLFVLAQLLLHLEVVGWHVAAGLASDSATCVVLEVVRRRVWVEEPGVETGIVEPAEGLSTKVAKLRRDEGGPALELRTKRERGIEKSKDTVHIDDAGHVLGHQGQTVGIAERVLEGKGL